MMTTVTTTPTNGIYLDPKPREIVHADWLGKHIAVKPLNDVEQIGVLMALRKTEDWQGEELLLAVSEADAIEDWRAFVFSGPRRAIEYVRAPRTEHWIATAGERASRPPRVKKDGTPREPRATRTRRTLQMTPLPADLPLDQLYVIADAVTGENGLSSRLAILSNADDSEEPGESFNVADLIDPEAVDALNAKLAEEFGEGPLPDDDVPEEDRYGRAVAEAEAQADAKAFEDSFAEEFPHVAAQAAEAMAIDELIGEAEDEATEEETRAFDPDVYQPSPDDDDENTLSPEQVADAQAAMMTYAAQKLKQPRRKSTGPRAGAKRGK